MRKPREKPRTIIKLFRIALFVGRDEYAVIPLRPHPGTALKVYRLHKQNGDRSSCRVSLTPFGTRCQCRAFRRRRRCLHVRMLRAAGMLN
jgi:hypothetical protein